MGHEPGAPGDPFAEDEDQAALRQLARDVAAREVAPRRRPVRRVRRGAERGHRRPGRRRPVPGDHRRAVGWPGHGRRRGGHRARGGGPPRRFRGHLLPTGLQRATPGDRAPRLAGPQGSLAPGRGRRGGHRQHRDHRARCRLGGPGHAHRPQSGRRRVATQRLQELFDPGPRRRRRPGVVPLAGRRGGTGHRGGGRAHGPRGGGADRPPPGYGHPRGHRVGDRLRRCVQ